MSVRRVTKILFLSWTLAVGVNAAERADGPVTGKVESSAATEAFSPLPSGTRSAAQPGRLRFRGGPVCMCAGGMSEAEIEAASRRQGQKGGN